MSVKLVMFNTQGHRRAFRLSGAETVIGRSSDCGLCIPLSDVSRRHCLLTVLDNEVRLKDLGSTNGTYVNSKRISEAILQPGDRITIGPIILTLQVNGVPTEGTRPESVPAGDSDDTVLADIEAAIALGPDELEDSRADLDVLSAIEQDPLDTLESMEQDAAGPSEPTSPKQDS